MNKVNKTSWQVKLSSKPLNNSWHFVHKKVYERVLNFYWLFSFAIMRWNNHSQINRNPSWNMKFSFSPTKKLVTFCSRIGARTCMHISFIGYSFFSHSIVLYHSSHTMACSVSICQVSMVKKTGNTGVNWLMRSLTGCPYILGEKIMENQQNIFQYSSTVSPAI